MFVLLEASVIRRFARLKAQHLPLRSGIPRDSLSELHGNLFMEVCESCGTETLREGDVHGVGLRRTGLRCGNLGPDGEPCGGHLRDALLDWDDELPLLDASRTEEAAESAALSIVLGSSLRIEPAASMCVSTATEHGGQVVIVNLQRTPKDDVATLKINGRCDDVLRLVMQELGVRTPAFTRIHEVLVSTSAMTKAEARSAACQLWAPEGGESELLRELDDEELGTQLTVWGKDHRRLPFVESVTFRRPGQSSSAVMSHAHPISCWMPRMIDVVQLDLQLSSVLVAAGSQEVLPLEWKHDGSEKTDVVHKLQSVTVTY